MPNRRAGRDPIYSPSAAAYAPRRLACVWLPQFAIDLECLRRPELVGRPLVLVGSPSGSGVEQVLAAAGTGGTGVAVGMPAQAVVSRCADAVALPYDSQHYVAAFTALLERLDAVSPFREPVGVETIYLDLTGLPHLDPEDPWQVQTALAPHLLPTTAWRLGIATGRFTSWCAAHVSKPHIPMVVPDTDKEAFLDRLPITLLPAEPRTLEQLSLLGLRTLGQLSRLPRSAVLARLGWRGERLHRLASGEDREPLVPYESRPTIRESLTFAEPATTVAEFEAALETLIRRLWMRRDRPRGGVRQMALYGCLENGTLWDRSLTLRRACEQWPPVMAELNRRLEGMRPAGALVSLSVEVTAAAPDLDRQAVLLVGEREHRQQLLCRAVEELRTRLGRTAIYRLTEISPSTPIPEHRWRLIAYEPSMTPGPSAFL